jgi:hypothetical protein
MDGKITLKWIVINRTRGAVWIYLAQDSFKELAVVNTVMNIRLAQNTENFLISEEALGSWPMEKEISV